jgi:hypothetical protein
MQTAFITPISRKAKNRFANLMDSNPHCTVEQHRGGKLFIASQNRNNFFWMQLDKDPDWMLQF